jgi:RHS repeat-associated protein
MKLKTILCLALAMISHGAWSAETTTLRIDSYSEKSHSYTYNKHEIEFVEISHTTDESFDVSNLLVVELDKEYTVAASLVGPGDYYNEGDHTVSLHLDVPDGYTVLIDSYIASAYEVYDDYDQFSLIVTKSDGGRPGVVSVPAVKENVFSMDFGVGALANGEILPPVRMRAELSGTVTPVLDIGSVVFSRPQGNVWHYQSGNHKQVKKPDIILDIREDSSADELELKYYETEDTTGTLSTDSSAMTVSGATAFHEVIFSKISTTKLLVEEKRGSSNDTITHVVEYVNGTWIIYKQGITPNDLERKLVFSESGTGTKTYYHEFQRKESGVWETDYLVKKEYKLWEQNGVQISVPVRAWEDPTIATAKGEIGTNTGQDIFTQIECDTYGRPLWNIDSKGKWNKTDYIADTSNTSFARPSSVFTPFEDGFIFNYNSSNEKWELKQDYSQERRRETFITYNASLGSHSARLIGDFPTQVKTNLCIPGANTVSQTDFTYSESTKNSKIVLTTNATSYQYPQLPFFNGPQTLTTSSYWRWLTGVDTLFVELPFSTTEPSGIRTVYVHETGDWNGTSFTPSSSGYAWRTVVYTGHSLQQSGSTLLSLSSTESEFSSPYPDIETLYLIPHRSTKSVQIRDKSGNVVRQENYGWGLNEDNGSNIEWIPTGSTAYTYDVRGHLKSQVESNGDTWNGYYNTSDQLSYEVLADGQRIDYVYDDLGRVEKRIKSGLAGAGDGNDIETIYQYDSIGNVLKETTKGVGNSEELYTLKEYDQAGILKRERTVNNIGHEYVWTQDSGTPLLIQLTSKQFANATNSSGDFVTTSSYDKKVYQSWYIDGAPKREWGDVVEETQHKTQLDTITMVSNHTTIFGTETDLTGQDNWTDTDLEDKKWRQTHSNPLGRITLERYPAKTVVGGTDSIGEVAYVYGNSGWENGKLIKVTQTGQPDRLLNYDCMGFVNKEGYDGNGDGVLTSTGSDADLVYENLMEVRINWTSNPHLIEQQSTYDDNDVKLILSRTETMLDGFTGDLRASVAEKVVPYAENSWADTGAIVRERHVTPSTREVYTNETVWSSNWTGNLASRSEALEKNGYLIESKSTEMWADLADPVKFDYDHLGRKESEEDTRGYLQQFVYYPGTTQIHELHVHDESGILQKAKEFEYCGCGGQIAKEVTYHGVGSGVEGASSEVIYTYYQNGLLESKYGNGTMPTRFEYDDHGEKRYMWLYPSGTVSTDPAVGNKTTWEYYANGALNKKIDDSGTEVFRHTYNSDGKLFQTITPDAAGPVVKYHYYQSSGLRLLYSMTYGGPSAITNVTPNVSQTYDRLGRVETTTATYKSGHTSVFSGLATAQTWTNSYSDALSSEISYGKLTKLTLPRMYNEGVNNRTLNYTYEDGIYWVKDQVLKSGTSTEWSQGWSFYGDGRPMQLDFNTGNSVQIDWENGTRFVNEYKLDADAPNTYLVRDRQMEVNRPFFEAEVISEQNGSGTKLNTFSTAFYDRDLQGRVIKRELADIQFEGYGQYDMISTFYKYNYQGELIDENTWANGEQYQLSDRFRHYTYDRAGNREDKRQVQTGFTAHGSNSSNGLVDYTPTSLNQYSGINMTEQWVTIAGMYDPVYDLDVNNTNPDVDIWVSGTNYVWNGAATAAGTGARQYWSVPLDVFGSSTSKIWRSGSEHMENRIFTGGVYFPPKDRSPTYDQRGNMTSDGYLTYSYDAENRLVKVTDGLLNWHFLYDPMGRRIRQKQEGWFVENSAGGWVQDTVYDSLLVYDEWHPILEDVIDGGEVATSQENLFYWGPDISNAYGGAGGIGGLLMIYNQGMGYMPGYDGNGNIINLVTVEENPLLVAEFEYDAFGQTVREEGIKSHILPFRYQTKWSLDYSPTDWLDLDIVRVKPKLAFELYDYGMRWYHPDQGRFINQDPIQEEGGLNLYAFVNNDPVNNWDMLGKCFNCSTDYFGFWSNPYSDLNDLPEPGSVSIDSGVQGLFPLGRFMAVRVSVIPQLDKSIDVSIGVGAFLDNDFSIAPALGTSRNIFGEKGNLVIKADYSMLGSSFEGGANLWGGADILYLTEGYAIPGKADGSIQLELNFTINKQNFPSISNKIMDGNGSGLSLSGFNLPESGFSASKNVGGVTFGSFDALLIENTKLGDVDKVELYADGTVKVTLKSGITITGSKNSDG